MCSRRCSSSKLKHASLMTSNKKQSTAKPAFVCTAEAWTVHRALQQHLHTNRTFDLDQKCCRPATDFSRQADVQLVALTYLSSKPQRVPVKTHLPTDKSPTACSACSKLCCKQDRLLPS